MAAWGRPFFGQLAAPPGLSGVVGLAPGYGAAMALLDDGRIVGWGDFYEWAPAPTDLAGVVALAAASAVGLALTDNGQVTRWGCPSCGAYQVPPGLSNVVAFSVHRDNGLALVSTAWPRIVGVLPSAVRRPAGGSALWVAHALGPLPLHYQWQKDGVLIPDARRPWLYLEGLTLADAGSYTVSVTSPTGSAESEPARLEVFKRTQTIGFETIADLAMSDQPIDLVAWATSGLPVSFAVVSGPAQLTGVRLTLTGPGTIRVRASQAGNDEFEAAPDVEQSFIVFARPAVFISPATQLAATGARVTFRAEAAGSPPFRYQWQFEGQPLTGAITDTLTLVDVGIQHAGTYRVAVASPGGNALSAEAILQVNTAPRWGVWAAPGLYAGEALDLQIEATDPEVPPQRISYTLGPDGPTEAVLGRDTGRLLWLIGPSVPVGVYALTLVATDNGQPPLAATNVVRVTVLSRAEAPRLFEPRLSSQGFEFRWNPHPARLYRVQYCPNLSQPSWSDFERTNVSGSFIDPSPAAPQRFYRVLSVPNP